MDGVENVHAGLEGGDASLGKPDIPAVVGAAAAIGIESVKYLGGRIVDAEDDLNLLIDAMVDAVVEVDDAAASHHPPTFIVVSDGIVYAPGDPAGIVGPDAVDEQIDVAAGTVVPPILGTGIGRPGG
mmetsp:Transcript_37745/g.82715  ORF Transcript_37745/g.82715 Transcript_37745/m.82715 type:complete len:127 (-) Transcript_37745:321-701(-)